MNLKTILWLAFLVGLSIVAVIVTNYFLEALLTFLVPGASMTPDTGGSLDIIIDVVFLVVDIITVIAIFKWLRR